MPMKNKQIKAFILFFSIIFLNKFYGSSFSDFYILY